MYNKDHTNRNKHLTFEERVLISEFLSSKLSFKEIARRLCKDPTTIAKEVKKNSTLSQTGCPGKNFNNCSYRNTCSKASVCSDCSQDRKPRYCRFCSDCIHHCSSYKPDICEKLAKPPYVCNGCSERSRCTLEKNIYHGAKAHQKYKQLLSEARTGISFSEEEVKELDALFSPLIKQGQSIHHIYNNHKDEVMVSESTIYNLVDYSLFEARNIDLPRKVRFSPKKKKKTFKVDRQCRINRTYFDYRAFVHDHPNVPVTQIDSVEGVKGGKVLLTIHFVKAECMIAFIRDKNTAASVTSAFNHLYEALTPERFKALMPLILGDNGSEFSDPTAIEFDNEGNQRTKVFYCDPSSPGQKGSAERNHEFIRFFVPKGKSFNSLTQENVDLMMSHIASYSRPSLLDKTPYEMMKFYYGKDVCDALNLTYIEPDKVTLNASIFSNKEDNDET